MSTVAPDGNDLSVTEIDTTVAHPARVYDYLLGGATNFAADREAAELALDAFPGGAEAARHDVRANRAFLGWAVGHLAGELGVGQFLDIGTGIPSADNVHAVAQQTAPESRIVYVDRDPIVLAHAHELLRSTPEGATAFVQADLRDPHHILTQAADTLDLARPVAVVLCAILHFDHGQDPYPIVASLLDGVSAGSYLVISHLAADIQPDEMKKLAASVPESAGYRFLMRTHAEVSRFFDGLELVHPGVAWLDDWADQHHVGLPPPPDGWRTPYWAAIGRTT